MFGYRVPAPDEAMLISGRGRKTNIPKIVVGHGSWYMPLFSKVRFLSLAQQRVDIKVDCRTSDFITLGIEAVVAYKVYNDQPAIALAAERYTSQQKREELHQLSQEVFTGHLRGIIAKMSAKQVSTDRDTLQQQVMDGCKLEVSAWGLTVDSLQIKTISDKESGYYEALAAPEKAAVKRDAEIASAIATQVAAEAVQVAERLRIDQIRTTELKAAGIKAEVDKANADSQAAGQLAQADVERQVAERNKDVAAAQAELVQSRLVTERIRPAEAEAQAMQIAAQAQAKVAEQNKVQASHVAEANKVAAVRAAEAAAEKTRLDATAARDAAVLNAEAIRAEGEADAAADLAKGRAAAETTKLLGEAEGAGELAKAEALAASSGAQLERLRIEALPNAMRAAAEGLGLSNANLNITNGAEGLGQVLAVLAPTFQVMATMAADFIASKTEERLEPPSDLSSLNGTRTREEGYV